MVWANEMLWEKNPPLRRGVLCVRGQFHLASLSPVFHLWFEDVGWAVIWHEKVKSIPGNLGEQVLLMRSYRAWQRICDLGFEFAKWANESMEGLKIRGFSTFARSLLYDLYPLRSDDNITRVPLETWLGREGVESDSPTAGSGPCLSEGEKQDRWECTKKWLRGSRRAVKREELIVMVQYGGKGWEANQFCKVDKKARGRQCISLICVSFNSEAQGERFMATDRCMKFMATEV